MANTETYRSRMVGGGFAISLIGSIVVLNSFIALLDPSSRTLFSDWTVSATALIALGVGLLVLYRQKQNGFHDRTYTSLVIALALWFVAERISTYYSFGLGTETQFPSFADISRLSGFAFFAYHLFRTHRLFGRSFKSYWALLSVSMLLNAVAYIGSTLGAATDLAHEIWVFNLLYNAGYICIAAALFWHNRVFIFDNRGLQETVSVDR